MHVEVLVEELSAEVALRSLLPELLGPEVSFEIRTFQGKRDLLAKLPNRLRGYANWVRGTDTRIVVLVDEDREDCVALKQTLERHAAEAGLVTKSMAAPGEPFVVLNRIAVEELEAWFFGDCDAIRAAYPRVPKNLENRAPYRHPDAIAGGTAERLGRVLNDAGYHKGGLAKVAAATDIAPRMDPARNSSPSFRAFADGVRELIAS